MHDRFSQRIDTALERLARRIAHARKPLDPAAVNRQIGRLLQRNQRAAARFVIALQSDDSRAGFCLRVARNPALTTGRRSPRALTCCARTLPTGATGSSGRRTSSPLRWRRRSASRYTDRGSRYFVTPEGGRPVSRTVLTQFGRALKQLGIEHIADVLASGAGPFGASVWNDAGSSAERTEAGWDLTRSRRPTAGSASATSRRTTSGSRSVRSRRVRHSWRIRWGHGERSCAFRRNGAVGTVKWERLPPEIAAELVATTLRQDDGAGARISGRPGWHRLADYAADGGIIQAEACAIPVISSSRMSGTAMPRRLALHSVT